MSSSEEIIVAYYCYRRLKRKYKTKTQLDTIKKKCNSGILARLYSELVLSNERFCSFAGMSPSSFENLLGLVQEDIKHRLDSSSIDAVSPQDRLLLTLRFLLSGETFKTLDSEVHMGHRTIAQVVHETCDAIWRGLEKSQMPVLKPEQYKEIGDQFFSKWNYPNCIGCIDKKFIKVKYHPRRQAGGKLAIMVLQCVVDANSSFIAVDIQRLGKSEEEVFRASPFGRTLLEDTMSLPQDRSLAGSVPLPFVFLSADEAYPILRHLMRPFPMSAWADSSKIYNQRHFYACRAAKQAISLLSAKWRVLNTVLNMDIQRACKVIRICCALHNFIKRLESEEDISHEEEENKKQLKALVTSAHRRRSRSVLTAAEVRDSFAKLFQSSLSVSWQQELNLVDTDNQSSMSPTDHKHTSIKQEQMSDQEHSLPVGFEDGSQSCPSASSQRSSSRDQSESDNE